MTDELKIAIANAAAEGAKLGTKALGLVEGTGRFFEQVLGPGAQHLSGAFSDWAAAFRYQNMLKISAKIDADHKARGIVGPIKAIDPRLAIPLIQSATLESDDKLQSLWAGLIANATDPSKLVEARRDFVALLSALEPLDARCLFEIQGDQNATVEVLAVDSADEEQEGRRPKRNVRWLASRLNVDPALVRLSVEGLDRHSLIVDRTEDPEDIQAGSMIVPVTHKEADLWLSFTGAALLEACALQS